MSKWYEVTVTQVIVFAVEVEDNEDEEVATDLALSECSMDGDRTAESEFVAHAHRIETIKRLADQIISLGD